MANFDNYTNYADNAGVSSVIFGAGSTVLEVELNEMQEIQTHYLREVIRNVIGDGISDASKMTYANNKFSVADGCSIMCNGYIIKTDRLEIEVTSGTIYLQVWEEEVNYNDTLHVEGNYSHVNNIENWIKDSRADNETTRRKVVRYQLIRSKPSHPRFSYVTMATFANGVMTKVIKEINLSKLSDRVTVLENE